MPIPLTVPSWLKRLDVRMVLLLSLALLPLGLISVFQTTEVNRAADQRSRLSLQLLTEQAASRERRIVDGAFGAAVALASTVPAFRDDPAICHQRLSEFLRKSSLYSFVGFIGLDAQITCSSANETINRSGSENVRRALSDKARAVNVVIDAPASQQTVVNILEPVFVGADFIGLVTLSVPHAYVDEAQNKEENVDRSMELITFNSSGQVLSAQGGMDGVSQRLPVGRDLAEFSGSPPISFIAEDGFGRPRLFVIVPILPDTLYALGRWRDAPEGLGQFGGGWVATVFPFVMWLTSLGVAYIALHRLVIRHVRMLQAKMRAFALHRNLSSFEAANDMPTELSDMNRTLSRMTEIVLRDEAELENSLHERDVLLKEVHHRVKNNLQLISSIMNMQMRKVKESETRMVLRRLQDRVLGLATIHRNLYQTDHLSRVHADVLLQDIVSQITSVGFAGQSPIDIDVSPGREVTLYPDQAVPFSLLATETLTNAIKYIGIPEGRDPWLRVRLGFDPLGQLIYSVENSKGRPITEEISEPASGLGSRLIAAFAQQLGAAVEIDESDTAYRVTVRFATRGFQAESSEADDPELLAASL